MKQSDMKNDPNVKGNVFPGVSSGNVHRKQFARREATSFFET
jgi:hypothetical protein